MIRFAMKSDIPAIMKFIDIHWKSGHILGRDESFFMYEFLWDEKLNFVISLNTENMINGVEGFIPYGRKNRDIMVVIWMVLKSGNPMLGLEILNYIIEHADARSVSSPGINAKTIGIYQYMGFTTGQMTQWYRLNAMKIYKIAKITNSSIIQPRFPLQYELKLCQTFEELRSLFDFEKYYAKHPRPLKEDWYIEKRYYNHPIFNYMVYGIETGGNKVETLVIFRIQEFNGCQVLRCIDVIGNYEKIFHITDALDELMDKLSAEYVDFYEIGLAEEHMKKAGWLKVKDSGNIIPNYFSPYVLENIDINYFVQDNKTVLFKGDGDQDRPN